MVTETQETPFWTKRVLSLEEVANYTGYKTSYIKKLTSLGEIPFSKPNGKSLFFDRLKIEEWLLRNPSKSKSEIGHAAMSHITNSKFSKRKS